MKKADYIRKKQERASSHHFRDLCSKCFRPTKACFCQYLSPFETKNYYCFLMHPMEAKRSQIGTGRLTHLALTNSEIIVDTSFDNNERFNRLLSDHGLTPLLLYPGKDAINLDSVESKKSDVFNPNNRYLIFIIDGTWPCAKSMARDTKKLHSIQKICFKNEFTSQFDIKHQPAKYCLSTIESTYHLLDKLKKIHLENFEETKKENMLQSFFKMVEFHKKLANDPNQNNYHRTSNPVKKREERRSSKKWEKRSICFNI